jgi:hypothetical protein
MLHEKKAAGTGMITRNRLVGVGRLEIDRDAVKD